MTARPRFSVEWSRLIRDLRVEAGLSQRALSIRCGVNRSSIRRLETGAAVGDIPSLEIILSALGYELEVVVKPASTPKDHHHVKDQPGRRAFH